MCLLWLAVALRAAEPEYLIGVDDKWRHLQSPNFELYSRNSDRESRDLLHNLELLRAEFIDRFKVVERTKLDVTVYFFQQLTDFRIYSPDTFSKSGFFRGFYIGGPDRAMISVAPIDNWEDSRPLIFHEYVHHLFQVMEQDPPVWFNEGMAELLAGIRIEGDRLEIGRPHAGRLMALRAEKLLPLETLFAVDHDSKIYTSNDHTGLFYAESWALLHYWYFGDSGLKPEAVERFLRVAGNRKIAAKVNLRAFFRECFAMDYPDMLNRLDRYVVSGSYRFGREAAPTIAAASTYAVRPVPREELRVRLAELAVRANRAPEGTMALLQASTATPPDPRALDALGADALLQHDEAGAKEKWGRAVAAGSRNAAVARELALLECRQWFADFNFDFQLPSETADRLRTRLLHAIELEPLQAATYEALAWVEAYAEHPVIANIVRVQHQFAALAHRDRTVVALALVRVRLQKTGEARDILSQLSATEPDAWSLQAAEVIQARLEGRLPQLVTTAGRERATVVEGGGEAAIRVRVPSVVLPPKP